MWDSSDVDTSLRSENEISTAAVKRYYGARERFFLEAVDAVVAGCVTEYSFDSEEMKFVGVVKSFNGNKSYVVKIFVTDDFGILNAICNCREHICCHPGAVALHSGFKTPIFSQIPNETGSTAVTACHTANKTAGDEYVDNPVDENDDDEFTGVITYDNDEELGPTEQMPPKDNDHDPHTSGDSDAVIRTFKYVNSTGDLNSISVVMQEKERKTERVPHLEWKKEPKPLKLTEDEWSIVFDSERGHFNRHSMHIFMEKLNTQFRDIFCHLRLQQTYTTALSHNLRFKCMRHRCSRNYRLSIDRRQVDGKYYRFEVRYAGKRTHRRGTRKQTLNTLTHT